MGGGCGGHTRVTPPSEPQCPQYLIQAALVGLPLVLVGLSQGRVLRLGTGRGQFRGPRGRALGDPPVAPREPSSACWGLHGGTGLSPAAPPREWGHHEKVGAVPTVSPGRWRRGTGCVVAPAARWHHPGLPGGPDSRSPSVPPAPAAAAGAPGCCPSRRVPRGSRLPAPRPRSPTSLPARGRSRGRRVPPSRGAARPRTPPLTSLGSGQDSADVPSAASPVGDTGG